MKETRFFYVPDAAQTNELPQEEATHALRVLRLQCGDEINLMDGIGNFYQALVSLTTNKRCVYEIKETLPQKTAWHGHIHIAIAPTKMMERIEWMAEKCTEIGWDELSFLHCKFSERKTIRVDRIDKIVISAVKQSHKAWKPIVNDMVSFKEFVSTPRPGRKFICHCYEEVDKIDLFTELQKPWNEDEHAADVTILVGPEGDFSIDEVKLALEHGYESVSLGTSRLRTETAGLMAVAMSNLARRI